MQTIIGQIWTRAPQNSLVEIKLTVGTIHRDIPNSGLASPTADFATIRRKIAIARMFKTQIDSGMRAGIPRELWKGAITAYRHGDLVQVFTGNQGPDSARVVLLDRQGNIILFHDRGFPVNALNKLREALEDLRPCSDYTGSPGVIFRHACFDQHNTAIS